MKVLVISDNHGYKETIERVLKNETYDISIHLGDAQLSEEWVAKRFTYYVAGNHDWFKYNEVIFEIDSIRFAICHGHTIGLDFFNRKKLAIAYGKQNKANVVLHGHTHIYDDYVQDNIRVLCPGSSDLSRGPEGNSYCIININNQTIESIELKKV